MKLISAIVCATAAAGVSLAFSGTASATDVQCTSTQGTDITVIDGSTACRAATDLLGEAKSFGIDGIGYANATAGARALGIGIAGGVGAGEGSGGIPLAIGVGQDAIALSSIDRDDVSPAAWPPVLAVSVAFEGSRASARTAEASVICLGGGAFAWNSSTGDTCLSTPLGRWQTGAERLP
ncbi:DUF6764 family protein [Nocardia brasiliensis]|uniref:DUF6764 family protein n=1 Tax=Nocardia brasiliensis TaxID=37326 RepID=UPI0004A6EE94|nr:DUF6764 family protein [Nocardia brasiliensis]